MLALSHRRSFSRGAALRPGQADLLTFTDPSVRSLTLSLNGCKMNINCLNDYKLRTSDEFKQPTILQRDFHQYSLYLECNRADVQCDMDLILAKMSTHTSRREDSSHQPRFLSQGTDVHADVQRDLGKGVSSY